MARWITANAWVAEDVKVGKSTSFPRQRQAISRGETVVFSWITYKSARSGDRRQRKGDGRQRLDGMMETRSLPSTQAHDQMAAFEQHREGVQRALGHAIAFDGASSMRRCTTAGLSR